MLGGQHDEFGWLDASAISSVRSKNKPVLVFVEIMWFESSRNYEETKQIVGVRENGSGWLGDTRLN